MAGRVVILMGSKGDLEHIAPMRARLEAFGIPYAVRVASAHKSVHHLLSVIAEYSALGEPLVFIAVAGRSNALAGMLDANTPYPVITCPPVSSAFGGADIYSSLRMPSGVAPLVILDPAAAALAAAKILSLGDADLRVKVEAYQKDLTAQILRDDAEVRGVDKAPSEV
ncbi:MAG: AIR carboxylase family protein [Chloroflexi bacterium]|nr:AIR carboxylase family protein [Chloroflexota bacterium]